MKCGKKCEIYTRVVGFHRPIQNWNKGKRAEFADRVAFQESHSLASEVVSSHTGVKVHEVSCCGEMKSNVPFME